MKDSRIYIEHMLEAVRLIEEYTQSKAYAEFIRTPQLQDAIVRRLEIIGEASNRIPAEIKSNFSDIPWKKISGMRNIIVHDYMGIDWQAVWNVVQDDLSSLRKNLEEVLKSLPPTF